MKEKEPNREPHKSTLKRRQQRARKANSWLQELVGEELGIPIRNVPPEGWMTEHAIAENRGKSPQFVRRIIRNFTPKPDGINQEYEDDFAIFDDNSGIPRTFLSPKVVEIVVSQIPPKGWITNYTLSRRLGIGPKATRDLAERFEAEKDQFVFKGMPTSAGNIPIHYAPERVKEIEEFIASRPKAPKDWVSIHMLAQKLGVGDRTVKEIAEKHRGTEQDLFGFFRDRMGRFNELYSPELVEIISEEINRRNNQFPMVPAGWETIGTIAKRVHVPPVRIRKIIKTSSLNLEHETGEFRLKHNSRVTLHVSPALVTIIEDNITELRQVPQVPVGWLTRNNVAKKLGVDLRTLREIESSFRSLPEKDSFYFQFRDSVDRVLEYYSPELITRLEKEIKKRRVEVAPEGWVSVKALEKKLGVGREALHKEVERLRSDPSLVDDFKEIKNKAQNRTIRVNLSPRVIDLIISHFSTVQRAPEGWLTVSALALQLKTSAGSSRAASIRNILNELRNQKAFKEEFGLFCHKNGKTFEFISPNLIAIIKERLGIA